MAMKRKNLPEVVPELFEHEQFGQFRYIKRGEEIWFVAVDVCRSLDIQNTTQAVAKLDDDERAIFNLGRSTNGVTNTLCSNEGIADAISGWIENEMNFVNEFGLYNLILSSRKPEAKKFKRWVTHEVLPSIRKYGYYVAPQKIEENLPELPAPNTVVKDFEEITTLMKKNGDEWYYEWIETANSNGEKKYELGLKPFPCYVAKIIWDD